MLPYEACCLGSINLSKFVDEDKSFDYDKFKQTIRISVQMLNNVIDKNIYPLKQIEEICLTNRKIGVGVMGYADMLIKMGLKFGSDEALAATEEIASAYQIYSENASEQLAENEGCFKSWKNSSWFNSFDYEIPRQMRNATVTTIAPTGSISIIAECSSGIEPIFSPVTVINRVDSTFVEIHPLVEEELRKHCLYEKFISDESPDLKNYLPELNDLIVTAHEVTPEQHVKTQAIWQKYTHNAVSKTINLPNSATKEDVLNVYMMAYDSGCKGITVYRDGSRNMQVLSTKEGTVTPKRTTLSRGDIICVSDDLLSAKRTIVNGCGKFYLHTDFDEDTGEMMETFIDIGSGGGCERNLQFISRLISLLLRVGATPESIIDQANSIRPCTAYLNRARAVADTSIGTSCPSAIGFAIKELNNKIHERCFEDCEYVEVLDHKSSTNIGDNCPECGGRELIYEGGCNVCKNCGWSKCS